MARTRGYRYLDLYTHERMPENIALYECIGYRETARRTEHGHDRVYPHKTLISQDESRWTSVKPYGDHRSGNCYKVELLMALLERPHEWVDVDILAGEPRTPAFLARNPNGGIPVLELPDGRCLSESNAILNFLAAGSEYLPEDRFDLAKVQQWQFFEQYSHEPYVVLVWAERLDDPAIAPLRAAVAGREGLVAVLHPGTVLNRPVGALRLSVATTVSGALSIRRLVDPDEDRLTLDPAGPPRFTPPDRRAAVPP